MRKRRPLERTLSPVRDASLVVIASEDTYAVKQYFDFFRSTRIQFQVLETLDGRSAPAHVLARLDEYMLEYDIGSGDTFWIICDCDHWIEPDHIRNLTSVLRQCRQKNIRFALSHPCFDLWLYLHFADFPVGTNLASCDEVNSLLCVAVGCYDKYKIYNLPIDDEKVAAAIRRSRENQSCKKDIPDCNQTSIHEIIEHLVSRKIITVKLPKPADKKAKTSNKKPSKK